MSKLDLVNFKADFPIFQSEPILLFAGQLIDETFFKTPLQKHNDFCEIIYISEGTGEFGIGGKQYPVRQGDIIIYNKGVEHMECSTPLKPFKAFYCGISNLEINGINSGNLLPDCIDPVIHAEKYSYKIEGYLSEIFQECTAQITGYETICINLLESMIIFILRIINADSIFCTSKETVSISYKIKEYIDKNYTRNITLKDIANTLYVSQHYLSHIFKKDLGDSPINYLITRRINEAKKLLISTDKPILEVSSMVAYENVQYFTMLFKKVTGQSPGEYRNNNRKDKQ